MNNSNWQTAGAYKAHAKKSQSKRTSLRKRSSRKPSKKQLAALAKGRAIRAKNIKKRRSGQKKQRGGANPITKLEKLKQQKAVAARVTAESAAAVAEIYGNRLARVETEYQRKKANEASARREAVESAAAEAAAYRKRLARVEAEYQRKKANEASARRVRWPWS